MLTANLFVCDLLFCAYSAECITEDIEKQNIIA